MPDFQYIATCKNDIKLQYGEVCDIQIIEEKDNYGFIIHNKGKSYRFSLLSSDRQYSPLPKFKNNNKIIYMQKDKFDSFYWGA